MNALLIFFALPISVVIFSIILQKIFKCPIIVASITFAIFLIVSVVIGTFEAVVAAIAYTLLSLLTAYIVMIISRLDENEEVTTIINTQEANCTSHQKDETITIPANMQPISNCGCGRNNRIYR